MTNQQPSNKNLESLRSRIDQATKRDASQLAEVQAKATESFERGLTDISQSAQQTISQSIHREIAVIQQGLESTNNLINQTLQQGASSLNEQTLETISQLQFQQNKMLKALEQSAQSWAETIKAPLEQQQKDLNQTGRKLQATSKAIQAEQTKVEEATKQATERLLKTLKWPVLAILGGALMISILMVSYAASQIPWSLWNEKTSVIEYSNGQKREFLNGGEWAMCTTPTRQQAPCRVAK